MGDHRIAHRARPLPHGASIFPSDGLQSVSRPRNCGLPDCRSRPGIRRRAGVAFPVECGRSCVRVFTAGIQGMAEVVIPWILAVERLLAGVYEPLETVGNFAKNVNIAERHAAQVSLGCGALRGSIQSALPGDGNATLGEPPDALRGKPDDDRILKRGQAVSRYRRGCGRTGRDFSGG